MNYALASLALSALGASALSLSQDEGSCSFTLTAKGGPEGIIGQLDDGQNRIGGGHPTGNYKLSKGQIIDDHDRGCILTPPTTQLQCDVGATPTPGFSIGDKGAVDYNGNKGFWACPASDSEWNIYTQPVGGQDKCVQIELTASGCHSAPPPPPPTNGAPQPPKGTALPQPKTKVSTVTEYTTSTIEDCHPNCATATSAPAPPAKETSQSPAPQAIECPALYPRLIMPVSKSNPTTSYGANYNATVTPDTSSIFTFDIPSEFSGRCNLLMLLPELEDLETSSYAFSGDGELNMNELIKPANESVTYATKGGVKDNFRGQITKPGNVVTHFDCPAGESVSFELEAHGDTKLEWFQDYNPSPIGLYIVSCDSHAEVEKLLEEAQKSEWVEN